MEAVTSSQVLIVHRCVNVLDEAVAFRVHVLGSTNQSIEASRNLQN